MTDLFDAKCPCCGQDMPQEEDASPFDDFWDKVPHQVSKPAARKAWAKLTAADRKAATERVKAWYRWFVEKHPQASLPHPASYLNGERWTDQIGPTQTTVPRSHRLAKAAESINSGKRFLCTQLPPTVARECIEAGLTTEAKCREVGVL